MLASMSRCPEMCIADSFSQRRKAEYRAVLGTARTWPARLEQQFTVQWGTTCQVYVADRPCPHAKILKLTQGCHMSRNHSLVRWAGRACGWEGIGNTALTLSFVIRRVLPRVIWTGTNRLVTLCRAQCTVYLEHATMNCVFGGYWLTYHFENGPASDRHVTAADQQWNMAQLHLCLRSTVMRRLTTGIRSEKCVVRRFRRCANVIQCTYTNLDSTV